MTILDERSQTEAPDPGWKPSIIAGVVMAVVAVIIVGVGLSTTDEVRWSVATASTAGAPGPPPADVFWWGDHDISEWITEAEITALLDDLSMRYRGVPLDGEAVFAPARGQGLEGRFEAVEWRVNPPGGLRSWGVHVARGSIPNDLAYVATDPRLPDGVEHQRRWVEGLGLWGPNYMPIYIDLDAPYGTFGRERPYDDEFEDALFQVGSMVLRELGWTETPWKAAAASSAAPSRVFDFSTDSLCVWFTAEDMNRIIAVAQEQATPRWSQVPFKAEDCVPPQPPLGERSWAGERGWAWDHTKPIGGPPSEGLIVDLVPVAWIGDEPAADFVGHDMLDHSVTYENLEYDCHWFEFFNVDLRVLGHEDDVLRFTLTRHDPNSECGGDEYQARVVAFGLAVADAMLREMNWID